MTVVLSVPRGERHVVWVARDVLAGIRQSATGKAPLETGGLLLGYQQAGATVICDWIGAGPKAVHDERYFEPDYDYQEHQLNSKYATSGRLHTYLGDWHTHPTGPLKLSRIDFGTLRTIARHVPARNPSPVMMILGPSGTWLFKCWRWKSVVSRALGYGALASVRIFDPD